MAYIQFSSIIPQKRETVFNYITDMNKYLTLLPSDISLSLVTPAPKMTVGVEYEFQIKRFGFSRSWTTKIDATKKMNALLKLKHPLSFKVGDMNVDCKIIVIKTH